MSSLCLKFGCHLEIGMFLMDRVGRKRLLVSGAVGMAVAMCGLAALGLSYVSESTASTSGSAGDGSTPELVVRIHAWPFILAIYVFVGCFAYSWGPCVWCLCSEIFPTAQRAIGMQRALQSNCSSCEPSTIN
eukprot:SAG31_NODE_330_length_17593_cov_4.817891_21_plen_132_part_00